MDKRKWEIRHAKKRLKERYGISAGNKFLTQIINQIKSGKANKLNRHSKRVSEYLVKVSGTDIRVIYDHKRTMIVTALPLRPP
jgi:hypothetical protein